MNINDPYLSPKPKEEPGTTGTSSTVPTIKDTPYSVGTVGTIGTLDSIATFVEDAPSEEKERIDQLHMKQKLKRKFKKVKVPKDMIILNSIGQRLSDLYMLEEFTSEDYRRYGNNEWDDHIYDINGKNISAPSSVEGIYPMTDAANVFSDIIDKDESGTSIETISTTKKSDNSNKKRKSSGGKKTKKRKKQNSKKKKKSKI